jgi:hypothetical protein
MYTGVLGGCNGLLGQHALNLHSIHTRNVALETLIARCPASRSIAHGHEAVEDLACAFLDGFDVAGELEEGLAVGAAVALEGLLGADDGAYHAGAHVSLLVGRDVGTRHGVVCVSGSVWWGGVIRLRLQSRDAREVYVLLGRRRKRWETAERARWSLPALGTTRLRNLLGSLLWAAAVEGRAFGGVNRLVVGHGIAGLLVYYVGEEGVLEVFVGRCALFGGAEFVRCLADRTVAVLQLRRW